MAGGRIDVEVAADLSNFNDEFSSGLESAGETASNWAGKIAGVLAVTGAAMSFSSIIDKGNEFQSGLNEIKGVTQATAVEMDNLKRKALELGSDIELSGTSTQDATTALTELAKGGFSVQEAMDGAKGSLQLASAAGIEAGEAATIQTNAIQSFGLGVQDAGHIADVFANAANSSSSEITDLAMGLQQSGAVAHGFGVSLEDTTATLGMFANAGITGSDAGTLLKTSLLSLVDQSKPAQQAMADLGLEIRDQNGNFVGMRSLFEQLETAAGGMSEAQFQAATNTLFGSDAIRQAMIAADGGVEKFDNVRNALDRQGAAAELANVRNEALPGVFSRIENASEKLQLQLYDLIDGPLVGVGNAFLSVADGAMNQFQVAMDNSGGVLVGLNEVISTSLTNVPMLQDSFGNLVDSGRSLVEMGVSVGNGLKSIAQGAMESGSVIDTLQGSLSLTTGVISTTFSVLQPLVGVVSTAVGAFGALPGPIQSVAVGLVALKVASMATSAFMARGVGDMGRMATAAHGLGTRIQGLPGTVRNLGTSLQTAGGNFRAFATLSGQAGAGVGRFAGSMQVLSTGSGSLSRIGQSFVTASTGAQRFGTAIGTLAAAGTGLKTMGGNLLNAVGGPWMIGIGAAIAALSIYSANQRKAAEHNRMLKQSAEELGKALYESNGALNATTQRAAANALESAKLAGTGRSLVEYLEAVGVSGGVAAKGLAGSRSEMKATLKVLEEQARLEAEVNDQRVGKGSEGFASTALGGMFNVGGARDKANEAANALADFKRLDEEARKLAESQRRIDLSAGFIDASGTATALGIMSTTMRSFGESTGGAASKIDILNGGLAKLRGDQLSTKDAQQAVNDAMRSFGEAAREAGTGVVDAAGNIDTSTAAGSRLYSELKNVMSGFDGVANAAYQSAIQQGKSHEDAAAAAEAAAQREIDAFTQTLLHAGYSEQAVAALITQFNLIPPNKSTYIQINDGDAWNKINALQTGINNLQVPIGNAPTPAYSTPLPFGLFGGAGKALGGSIEGGIPGKDSVPILGMPGEHVLTTTDVDNLGGQAGVYRFREALSQGKVGKYADGGAIGTDGLDRMIEHARAKAGIAYSYGPWDCSRYMSDIAAVGMGQQPRRLWTTYSILDGDLQGMQPGGNAGHFRIGVSQEHMAGTLFMKDGSRVDVENGGSNAGSTFGGNAAGYDDPQFPRQFHLPDSMLNPALQMALTGGASYTAGASSNPWTEKDANALESARVAIIQAQEDRDAVYANDKKSDADRQQADLKVQRAELKVKELEQKRDGAGSATSITPAPALTGAMTEDAIGIRNAEIAVLDAQLSRDKTYADATSTSLDKEKADIAVYSAQNRLEQAKKDAKEAKDGKTFSLNDRFRQFGSDVGGIVAGAILEQFPSQITESHWLTTDWEGLMGKTKTESTPAVASPSFSTAEIQAQLPTTPGVPGWQNMLAQVGDDWQKRLGEALNIPTVLRDNGGPVPHGTAALNLSGAEEWMLTADERLNLSRDFALMRGASRGGDGPAIDLDRLAGLINSNSTDNSINITNPVLANIDEFKRTLRVEQARKTLTFQRR